MSRPNLRWADAKAPDKPWNTNGDVFDIGKVERSTVNVVDIYGHSRTRYRVGQPECSFATQSISLEKERERNKLTFKPSMLGIAARRQANQLCIYILPHSR